jgi:hypothetical protein
MNPLINCTLPWKALFYSVKEFSHRLDPFQPDGAKMDKRPFSSIADTPYGVAKPKFNQPLPSIELPLNTALQTFAESERTGAYEPNRTISYSGVYVRNLLI